jgi:hypothetical protein
MPKFQDQQHCYGILCITLFGCEKGLWVGCCSPKKNPKLVNCDCKASKLHVVFPNLSNVAFSTLLTTSSNAFAFRHQESHKLTLMIARP